MKNVFVLLTLVAASILSGCVHPSITGKTLEVRQIGRAETVAVIWDLPYFQSPVAVQPLLRDGTYSPRFDACFNQVIEGTFSRNGYRASAKKVANSESEKLKPQPGARYVLAMHLDKAMASTMYGNPTGYVSLEGSASLYEQSTGKLLWTARQIMNTKAEENGFGVLMLFRGLAESGFLDLKAAEVVDYMGKLTTTGNTVSRVCP